MAIPLLSITNVRKTYVTKEKTIEALKGVSLTIFKGEIPVCWALTARANRHCHPLLPPCIRAFAGRSTAICGTVMLASFSFLLLIAILTILIAVAVLAQTSGSGQTCCLGRQTPCWPQQGPPRPHKRSAR